MKQAVKLVIKLDNRKIRNKMCACAQATDEACRAN